MKRLLLLKQMCVCVPNLTVIIDIYEYFHYVTTR